MALHRVSLFAIMQPMRIGLVSYEYPPQSGLGGVGTYVYRLAGALGRAGYEVMVLAGPTDQPTRSWSQPNVTLHRIPAQYYPPSGLGIRFLYWRVFASFMHRAHRSSGTGCGGTWPAAKRCSTSTPRTPLDVIEAPEHAANGLAVAKLQKWPTVIRVHGPWDLFFGINRTGTAMNRFLGPGAEAHVRYGLTSSPRRATRCRRSCRTAGGWTVANGGAELHGRPPGPAPLPPVGEEQRVVCAGRLERFKGQDALVRAFARIARNIRMPSWY